MSQATNETAPAALNQMRQPSFLVGQMNLRFLVCGITATRSLFWKSRGGVWHKRRQNATRQHSSSKHRSRPIRLRSRRAQAATETAAQMIRFHSRRDDSTKSSLSKVSERHANGTTAMSFTSGFSSCGSSRAMVQLSPFCSVPRKT